MKYQILGWTTVISNQKVVRDYARYIKSVEDGVPSSAPQLHRILEQRYSNITGGRYVGTTSNQTIPRFTVSDQLLENSFSGISFGDEPDVSTTIGQNRMSILKQIQKSAKTDFTSKAEIEEFLKSLSANDTKKVILSDSTLSALFYEKSKYLQISSLISDSKGKSSIKINNILFSEAAFRSKLFQIYWESSTRSLLTSLNDKYEKQLFNRFSEITPIVSTNVTKRFEKDFKLIAAGKTQPIQGKRVNNLQFSFFSGGSIPMSRATIRKTKKTKKYKTGQFMSVIALTELVRQRVRLRMRRGSGPARPPKMYERTGTFRNSIQVVANYRTNAINYFYLPYYKANEEYGYEVTQLVEGSIRAITQEHFKRQFNLTRETNPLF